MGIIIPVITGVVLVNAHSLRHALVHPTRARWSATLPRIALGSTAATATTIGVVIVVIQVHLVVHDLLVDQLLPLFHCVLSLIHTVVVGSRGGLQWINQDGILVMKCS